MRFSSDTVLHRLECVMGGFVGGYSIVECSLFGSAQTMNLIESVICLESGDFPHFLKCIGGLLVFVLSVASCALVKLKTRIPLRVYSLIFSVFGCLAFFLIPDSLGVPLRLYPSFAMTAVIWVSFSTPSAKVATSPIFSTNNVRQGVYLFVEGLALKDREKIRQSIFFAGSLIFFHVGVALGVFSHSLIGKAAVLLAIPYDLAVLVLALTVLSPRNRCSGTGPA